MSGLDNIMNKAKAALSDEKTSDSILDKAADFAKSKFKGHEDKIDSLRQKADEALGDKSSNQQQDASPKTPSPTTAEQTTAEQTTAEQTGPQPESAPSSDPGQQNEPPAGFPAP